MTAVTLPKGNLVFYFPFPTVGGVSILFIRLAKVLKEHWSVVLMDHPDGYMAQNLPFLDTNIFTINVDKVIEDCVYNRVENIVKVVGITALTPEQKLKEDREAKQKKLIEEILP